VAIDIRQFSELEDLNGRPCKAYGDKKDKKIPGSFTKKANIKLRVCTTFIHFNH